MGVQRVVIPYEPRDQFLGFHTRTQRWSAIVAHRRAGKTVACVNELIKGALICKRTRPRFAYIAPLLKQAKTVALDYLKEFGLVIPGASIHESELRLDLPNGGQVRLYGGDNPDSLRGIYLDGVILDEAADMSPRVFNEIIRPALSDRKGWCVWIGTPKGQNDFYDLWERAKGDPEWFSLMLRASETGIIDPHELADAKRQMTPEQFAQEYECSFQAAIIGAYYGREMDEAEAQGRVVKGLYDPTYEVHTSWDLGVSDHTVLWFFQRVGGRVHMVDYYAAAGYGLEHYAKVMQDRGYKYGRHFLPHDVEQRIQGGGIVATSRRQMLHDLGISVSVVGKHSLEDGIAAARKLIHRTVFDGEKCAEGIKALRQYRREYDDIRKVFYERPLHDWASHPADSFRYAAMGMTESMSKAIPKRNMGWVV
jgi:hypothetical protein